MRFVYAITPGGSTFDVLGVFEDQALAEAAVAEWRTKKAVFDDGWGIQELTVWDRLPTWRTLHKASVHVFANGALSASSMYEEAICEWDGVQPRETVTRITRAYVNDRTVNVEGADKQDVVHALARGIREAQEQIESG